MRNKNLIWNRCPFCGLDNAIEVDRCVVVNTTYHIPPPVDDTDTVTELQTIVVYQCQYCDNQFWEIEKGDSGS